MRLPLSPAPAVPAIKLTDAADFAQRRANRVSRPETGRTSSLAPSGHSGRPSQARARGHNTGEGGRHCGQRTGTMRLRAGVAIDLGTVNTLVCVTGRGLVLEEPSAIA